MLKLYKFRSLGEGCKDTNPEFTPLGLAKTILKEGMFWCSSLWEMNDPMEGIFSFMTGAFEEIAFNEIFPVSNKRGLCCFSGKKAFKRPSMWGYYANGFKGIAIEIEVDRDDVSPITYSNRLQAWETAGKDISHEEKVRKILTTKLKSWSNEYEYRFICDPGKNGNVKIGKITAVHFGWTYKNVENVKDIYDNSPSLRSYVQNMKILYELAKAKRILCFEARVEGNDVVSEPFDEVDLESITALLQGTQTADHFSNLKTKESKC